MAQTEKQEAERRVLMAFKDAYPTFPAGDVIHGDKPDAIVLGPRRIGIEITGFDLIDGGNDNSERQQLLRRNGVVQEAQKLYSANGSGNPVELTFGFDRISKRRRNMLPAELAEFAKRIEDKTSETIILERYAAPPELKFAWNAGQYQNPTWRAQQCYDVSRMDRNRLEQIIKEKELKIRGYEQCDAFWLLISVDFFNAGQDQEIDITDPYVHSAVFEKIFAFKTVFNHIVEIQ